MREGERDKERKREREGEGEGANSPSDVQRNYSKQSRAVDIICKCFARILYPFQRGANPTPSPPPSFFGLSVVRPSFVAQVVAAAAAAAADDVSSSE